MVIMIILIIEKIISIYKYNRKLRFSKWRSFMICRNAFKLSTNLEDVGFYNLILINNLKPMNIDSLRYINIVNKEMMTRLQFAFSQLGISYHNVNMALIDLRKAAGRLKNNIYYII